MSCGCGRSNCQRCACDDPCSIASPLIPSSACTTPAAQIQTTCSSNGDSSCFDQSCCTSNLFVETTAAFNMPACDGTGTIFVDDASRLFVGALLWSPAVGYLEVTEIHDASEIVVKNNCPTCQVLDAGQPVPIRTQFGVGVPFCADEGDITFSGPRLASDYFIPADGSCVTVAVTTIEGLSVGDVVSINSNRYRISEIPTTESIVICNDGEGGEPGTLVEADPDNDGILDYPIIRISSNDPCTADAVDSGRIIVCNAGTGGQQRALEGTIKDQIPAWDPVTNKFILKIADNLTFCLPISSCCLTLDPDAEDCSSYLVTVVDTTRFNDALTPLLPNPLKVTIDGDLFCVTEVVNSTTLRVVPAFDVTEIKNYDIGASICIASCCDQCTPAIQSMDTIGELAGCGVTEVLVGTGVVTISGVPVGDSTYTFPSSLAENDQSGFEEEAESFWKIEYHNSECCDCGKYVLVNSNFEVALDMPEDVLANVELRVLKTAPLANSQSFASLPFIGGFRAAGSKDDDLIPTYQIGNTWKNSVQDHDYVKAGESNVYKGHARLVFQNNSGAPVDVGILIQWRAWLTAQNYECADVTVTT